ncbi:tryptophan--tRNA ligase [Candidatus Sumerlaeota bacterium]|nr:tryptophan--tRNA ligase [Candidatus Sumerlaeota bacterium]MBI3734960.1 tryptophan--tRNA ligase [Candidatus Sumerlaeota bacterium]
MSSSSTDPAQAKSATRQRILSGNRPTGPLHLGNYLGAVHNWVGLQQEYDCFFMVADWHALTSDYADTARLPEFTRQMVMDWIGAGLDPARSALFVQSQVKEHAELALLLGMFTPIPWLERVPSFKDQQEQIQNKDLNTYGFLGYPVLQTADIVAYKAHKVPVGEDQLAHLEISRELVRRFNFITGREIFPEPQPILSHVPKLLGIDGRKMSKSYNNCIYLADPAPTVEAKVKEMVTDPARVRRADPGHPEVCSVYAYHEVFTAGEKDQIAADCRSAKIGCIECKKNLAKSLNALLDPMRERKSAFESGGGKVDDLLEAGAAKARGAAAQTMEEVREVLHLPNAKV